MPRVIFHGVRGSFPCGGPDYLKYGGNTSCVEIRTNDPEPIILDLGTGLVRLADRLESRENFRASVLLSHPHWDHIQGLPYFKPLHVTGSQIEIFAPPVEISCGEPYQVHLGDVFDKAFSPPLFPVSWNQLGGKVAIHELNSSSFSIGGANVTCAPVPHPGINLGFKIMVSGVSIGYVSDHQMPRDDREIDPEVLKLIEGVDLLIHDAQYSQAEFEAKSDWGHSTYAYAVHVAHEAQVKCLVPFHHDPSHSDKAMDQISAHLVQMAKQVGIECRVAMEGMEINL